MHWQCRPHLSNKIFCIASFCWRNSKRAHVNCDVDDIFLCRNQLTFFRMRRSTSYGRQKFRKKVTLFVQFLITTFIPWQKWWCTRDWCPRSGVVLESHVTKFADGEMSSAASFAVCHHLQHPFICTIWTQITSPLGLLFQIKLQDKYQVLSPRRWYWLCNTHPDPRYPHPYTRSYPRLTHIQDEMKWKANILREQW